MASLSETKEILTIIQSLVVIVAGPILGIIAFNRVRDTLTNISKGMDEVKDDVTEIKKTQQSQAQSLVVVQSNLEGMDRRAMDHAERDTERFSAVESLYKAEREARLVFASQVDDRMLKLTQQYGELKGTVNAHKIS